MHISSWGIERVFADESELETVLAELVSGGMDNLCIALDDTSFPMLALAICGDLATMEYYEREDEAGFRSLGPPNYQVGVTRFCLQGRGHKEEVANRFVLPYGQAVEAAKEFCRNRKLPQCVEWLEL